MEYHLISASQPGTFETEINGHLRNGWWLHGPTFIDPHNGAYCQAVKKHGRQKTLLETLAEKEQEAA